jgi:hypothetical protein
VSTHLPGFNDVIDHVDACPICHTARCYDRGVLVHRDSLKVDCSLPDRHLLDERGYGSPEHSIWPPSHTD